jgi:hypothetical protein
MKESAFFRFSPRILDHLGISAYNSLRKCLAELVANAYDADAHEARISVPDAIDENAVIELEDDGVGMSAEDIRDRFLFIGLNRREAGQRTAGGRLVIGSKGIGKLAGFGIASSLQLITRRNGVQFIIRIDRQVLDDVKGLSDHPLLIAETPTELPNGTRVRLMHLNRGVDLPACDALRRYLYKSLPKVPGFRTLVNDVECSAEDIAGERSDFATDIEGVGTVRGFYIVAPAKQPNPGIAVRVRGRLVKEPSLFGIDTRAHGFFTAEKIVGEVNAEFLDPEASSKGAQDLINTTRDGFLEDSPLVAAFDRWMREFLSKIVQGIDESERKRRTDALLERPAIKERLDKLPAHVRGTATQVVRAILAKLRYATDDEAEDLIEWVLRFYESNVLRELMKAIVAADVTDAERLAGLVEEWGLKQVSNVADIVKTQIDIILKLQELVASNEAAEIDLHKLIERNLWLIKEGLELWSSDKPLKILLEKRIEELYKDKASLRPDLVCRSRNGAEAVIIEFKRPKETVTMEHVTQALEYEALIKKSRPNITFTTYVVGRQYSPSVLAAREKLEGASLHLWSFEEILQKSRMRFERVLEILGR